jgi:DNA (cytosine-5)-methyltransferase 1
VKIDIFSFFSGAGFLDLGFENEGFRTVFVNENHLPFLEAYKYSRKKLGIKVPVYGYSEESIEDLQSGKNLKMLEGYISKSKTDKALVGFIGGPPCPDCAIGGKNKGKHGENGKLSQTYIDLIAKLKPDFFLFENVRGLWRTVKHRAFYEELKKQLRTNGYVLTNRLTNCIEFSVPQYRNRIFLIGIKKELAKEMSLDIDQLTGDMKSDSFPWEKYMKYPKDKALKFNWPTTTDFTEKMTEIPEGLPEELTVEYWFRKNDVTNHPNAKYRFTPREAAEKFKVIKEGDDCKKSFKRLHRWRYSPTACYGNNEVHLHPYEARRISVAEALAVQSLPKNFEFPDTITKTEMFKAVGNGVPYLAARMLAKTISDFLKGSRGLMTKNQDTLFG